MKQNIMHMIKKASFMAALLGCFFLLSSCSKLPWIEGTPQADNLEPCSNRLSENKAKLTPSWTWFEITVDKSTLTDLISKYGEPITRQPFPISNPEGCVFQYKFKNDKPVYFYVLDGIVREIEINRPSYLFEESTSISLGYLVKMYGKPQLVGFNTTYGSGNRTVVWPVNGVQAVVSLRLDASTTRPILIDIDDTDIVSLAYFAPTTPQEYSKSFLSLWFTETLSGSDDIDIYAQDPFNWQ